MAHEGDRNHINMILARKLYAAAKLASHANSSLYLYLPMFVVQWLKEGGY